jgi:hypothetical protein
VGSDGDVRLYEVGWVFWEDLGEFLEGENVRAEAREPGGAVGGMGAVEPLRDEPFADFSAFLAQVLDLLFQFRAVDGEGSAPEMRVDPGQPLLQAFFCRIFNISFEQDVLVPKHSHVAFDLGHRREARLFLFYRSLIIKQSRANIHILQQLCTFGVVLVPRVQHIVLSRFAIESITIARDLKPDVFSIQQRTNIPYVAPNTAFSLTARLAIFDPLAIAQIKSRGLLRVSSRDAPYPMHEFIPRLAQPLQKPKQRRVDPTSQLRI